MVDPVQVLWTPAGTHIPNLGAKALAGVSDGDTPNIRMPMRMLSVDTPEVTARSAAGAQKVDQKFAQLAAWIGNGTAPVSAALRVAPGEPPAAMTRLSMVRNPP